MKNLIFITFIFAGLLAAGCSTSPYVSLTETNDEQIEEKIIVFQNEEAIGAEISLLLKDGEEINGELLSVRDSVITLCTEYSVTEKDLASLRYPIHIVGINKISEITLEGNSNPLWIGGGIALIAGTAVYLMVKDDLKFKMSDEEGLDKAISSWCLVGGAAALPVWIGRMLSTEDVILNEIPPGYKSLPLKSLARYQDEEPEYLRIIK